ncbi:rhomboid family intramembrane serine protease [Hyphomicrobium sp. LHD-15]|uniref:rhomboid family intramembrane serine protease n=1 Tax=Hyphomicrobium sp. LHD-15 TaxID=3072142 RepID=UPI00280D7694|nr:rhomboid family intramembrane serine protease [Hyphomicrobium sp. LHD-15]MDQ8697838.1 rhomboid family intramembrane serine protease [Hyphomicrobium sp. LHD-15]
MIPANNTIPYTQRPVATLSIIGLCVAVFLYQLTLSQAETEAFFNRYALVPARFDVADVFTSMFLHGGFLHIASNLWTLWVFGPALEDRLGSQRFAALYLLSGVAAALLHVLFNFSSDVPTLGASGAIAGVIAAYARRFPYAWVNILQPIVIIPVFFMMPALAFAGFWFLSQIMQAAGSLAMPGGAGGIAWWAHIGGFLAGWFLLKRMAPPANAVEDATAAAQSAMWPWTVWTRWMTWWWRR